MLLPGFRYYDPYGNATDEEFRVEDIDRRRIAHTDGLTFDGRPAYLSTILIANAVVFLGAEGDKPFETQIRSADTEEALMTLRFASRNVAEETHAVLVKVLQSDDGRQVLEELVRVHRDAEYDDVAGETPAATEDTTQGS